MDLQRKKMCMLMNCPMCCTWFFFIFLLVMRVIDFKLDFEFKLGNLFHSHVKKATAYYMTKCDNDNNNIEQQQQ
jgi:hypothetical protein